MAVFEQVTVNSLQPHRRNSSIYGEENFSKLAELICDSQCVRPLVVTYSHVIISSHRRWKAVCLLGWETVPVEYREFSSELAELEAVLLENATRVKTIERKVREGIASKEIEAYKARTRQISLAGTRPNSNPDLMENFPQGQKGTTRDRLAKLVGLGSGRTYSKAAKVIERIDALFEEGDREQAKVLRQVLNERSVDAALKLVKHISCSNEADKACLNENFSTTDNSCASADSSIPQRSCWNCQHRGESIENHSFYCNRLGALSLLEKSADTRGAECDLWCDKYANQADNLGSHHTHRTFSLQLTAHLQPLIQDAARTTGMSVVDWATWVLESEAIATCGSFAPQQSDKTECQAAPCRGP